MGDGRSCGPPPLRARIPFKMQLLECCHEKLLMVKGKFYTLLVFLFGHVQGDFAL
jgi:hypothetical protein